ncbi:hypothetical protein ICN28_08130 [Polynucleobacter sp. 30F-ANTBAC]|jgi:tetrahydromethanopterin S-methyltransferase subunit E|uniref:hypothetical protein n=1 Tax=Polynucleobacter sp. 30F-ANTBAC TaxID=2689095 RepID=UPI001C0E779B|nr:hypothetical protein [Polynucleobacter sp. 30F-ANTBAC]MBU3600487.1 hypothetical protein [Polynucleobacter sp. 30F-ANTBAC]
MKKPLLTTICLVIYTFFEILVAILDVLVLAAAFCLPVIAGLLLKPLWGDLIAMIGVVMGVALFGIAFVYRKRFQACLQVKARGEAELLIERVRSKKYFQD